MCSEKRKSLYSITTIKSFDSLKRRNLLNPLGSFETNLSQLESCYVKIFCSISPAMFKYNSLFQGHTLYLCKSPHNLQRPSTEPLPFSHTPTRYSLSKVLGIVIF